MQDHLSDEDLAERAGAADAGDIEAFDALVTRYRGKVVTNCRLLTGSPSDAEDLAHDVFVRAYFSMRRFEGRSTFRTWLYRIKAHRCIDFNRQSQRRRTIDVDDAAVQGRQELSVAAEGTAGIEAAVRRQRIHEVLAEMSETLRVPVLHDVDGFSHDEIAIELDIGLSASKMRVKRGRAEFRRRFSELFGADDETSTPDGTPSVS